MTLQAASPIAPSLPVTAHQSPWHSPVPYLFGGLAAMLSLIAFALLILACSFSKEDGADGHGDLEAGDSKPNNHNLEPPPVFKDKYLVIMAGQAKPTFLATPVSSGASSFGSCSCQSNSTEKSSRWEVDENEKENEKQGSSDHLQVRTTENQETTVRVP